MSVPAPRFFNDESAAAEWLSAEIFAFARELGCSGEACARFCEIARRLAETASSNGETHLRVRSEADAEFLRRCLASTPENFVVGEASDFFAGKKTPLIFDRENSALYFFRHFRREVRTAKEIFRIARAERRGNVSPVAEKIIASALPFPLNAGQKSAVRAIVESSFVVVSGGPGTGKTTLLLRALLCIFTEKPDAEVLLVAPTGKAAGRMKESVRQQAEEIEKLVRAGAVPAFPPEALSRILALETSTLHRALHTGADALTAPRVPALDADWVVADEASMIDEALMARLLSALPPRARIVLLGDENQLDSVGPGHVFGALCGAPALSGARIVLTESRRFDPRGTLGRFAHAIVSGDTAAADSILRGNEEGAAGDGKFFCSAKKITPSALDALLTDIFPEKLRCVPEDADPAEMLALVDSVRVLSPLRNAPLFGSEALNARARALFSPRGNAFRGEHYHGRPIVITKNSSRERLYNGDVGIVLRERGSDALYAYFRDEAGALSRIPAAALPEHETAYAMSVNKAQGSEFSRLAVVFPPAGTREDFFSRQLLYTAVTRFLENAPDSKFFLLYDRDALLGAVARKDSSRSLLFSRSETSLSSAQ